jgi:hypothetical protein
MSCNNPCSITKPEGITLESAIYKELKCRHKLDDYPSYEVIKVYLSIEKEICIPFPSELTSGEKLILINSIINDIKTGIEDKVNSIIECSNKVTRICDFSYYPPVDCQC